MNSAAPARLDRLTTAIQIAANLVPLAGVLFRDWNLFLVVALYWLENLIIGAFNILKILVSSGVEVPVKSRGIRGRKRFPADTRFSAVARHPRSSNHASMVFLIPFFTFHYGMFCLVHGVFICVLLGQKGDILHGGPIQAVGRMIESAFAGSGAWAVAAIAISHLVRFIKGFIITGEYRRTSAATLMGEPYPRIIALHIAILFGSFATHLLGQPVILLVLLVIGKTLIDLKLDARSLSKRLLAKA